MFPTITLWRHVLSLHLHELSQVLHEVSVLSVEDVQTAAQEWIFGNASRRAAFVMMCSQTHEEDMRRYTSPNSEGDSAVAFRASQFHNEVQFDEFEVLGVAKRLLSYPNSS
jgi:hypothetical protein